MPDRARILAACFLRALATGLIGILLGLYLARREFSAGEIGLVIGAGLSGAALAGVVATFLGDRLGRRRTLLVLALLAAAGGVLLALTAHVAAAVVVAFLGMVNGMGRDRGAALILEQAILPQTVRDADRTRAFADGIDDCMDAGGRATPGAVAEARGAVPGRTVGAFAWYNLLQDSGHALGGLAAAGPALLVGAGLGDIAAYQWMLGLYALLLFITALLYLGLSPAVELAAPAARARVSPESRRTVGRIAALFALDSIAGGFLGAALLSYFFFERFGVGETTIAALFFAARIANAVSHLAAAWLARRIGLINTMVFTHIPSSLALVAVAFAPGFTVAAILFLIREALVEMDVPTRQSYVMAVVAPEERTWASGMTSLVRLGGWAVAPFAAGFLMQGLALATPLLVGAGLKIVYDLALYRAFRHVHPPEETPAPTS
jgi:MFS family permease